MAEMTKVKLEELFGKDLAGYQLVMGLTLRIDHGCMGETQAYNTSTNEAVVCLSEDLIKKVAKKMPQHPDYLSVPLRIDKTLLLVNISESYGFEIQRDLSWSPVSLRILTEEEFERLIKEEGNPFYWHET